MFTTLEYAFLDSLELAVCFYISYSALTLPPSSFTILCSRVRLSMPSYLPIFPPAQTPEPTSEVLNNPKQAGGSRPRIQDSPGLVGQSAGPDRRRYIWHLRALSQFRW